MGDTGESAAMSAGVHKTRSRVIACAAVAALCAVPSAAANLWPRLTHIWTNGAAGGDVAIISLLTLSVAGMVAVPFAMRNADSLLFWLTCLVTGIGLATFNQIMATETTGKWLEVMLHPAAVKQSRAAVLDSRIQRETAAIAQLPQLPRTSAAEVEAAAQAVKLATEARDQECGKVGNNCRDRVKELKTEVEKQAELLKARTNTITLEAHEAAIKTARAEREELEPIPTGPDPTMQRIANMVGLVYPLGERSDLKVIEWLPTWVAAMVEAIGLLLPRILLTAMGIIERRPSRFWPTLGAGAAATASWCWRRWGWGSEATAQPDAGSVAAPPAAIEIAAVRKGAATAAEPRKRNVSKAAAVYEAESVRQWFKSRTVARTGSKLKPKETYDTSFVPWCKEQGIELVTFTRFGAIMKDKVEDGGCGVVYEEKPKSKRGFYVDIALVGAPKLVASAIDDAHARRALGNMVSAACSADSMG